MSNKPMQSYFDYSSENRNINDLIAMIIKETNFIIAEKLWESKVYDDNKLATLVFDGTYEGKNAVLKIQLIKLDIDEIDIMGAFNTYNKSEIITIPALFAYKYIQSNIDYGYMITEKIENAVSIYKGIPTEVQIQDFLTFFKEYRTNCLTYPFVQSAPNEISVKDNLIGRLSNWVKISEAKGYMDEKNKQIVEDYISIIETYEDMLHTDFQHGHLSYNDIKKSDEKYYIMSIPFFGAKLLGYDAVYHIYNSLFYNDHNEDYLFYFKKWLAEYMNLGIYTNEFPLHYRINVLERCVGALLLDNYLTYKDKDTRIFEKNKKEWSRLYLEVKALINSQ